MSYVYRQRTGHKQRGYLAPYALVLHKQGLYVVARRLTKRDVEKAPCSNLGKTVIEPPPAGEVPTVFAAERFVEADNVRSTEFQPPSDLNIAALFQGAFGVFIRGNGKTVHVVIEFAKTRRTHALARTWHPTQIVDELNDGRVRISFDVADVTPIVSWVLSWGPHARVVAPESLVLSVAKELRQADEQYSSTLRRPAKQHISKSAATLTDIVAARTSKP